MDGVNYILKLRREKQSNCEKLYLDIIKKYNELNDIDIVKYEKLHKLNHEEKNLVKKYIVENMTDENKIIFESLHKDVMNAKECDKILENIIYSNNLNYYSPLLINNIDKIFKIKTDVLKRISKIKNINEKY